MPAPRPTLRSIAPTMPFSTGPRWPERKPFAVDDAHAAPLPHQRLRQKLAQRLLGLADVEAVQVDFPLHAVVAAAELAQHGGLNTGTVEDELLAAGEGGVEGIIAQALFQHGEPVGAGETRRRTRTPAAARRLLHRLRRAAQGLDVSDRFTKQLRLIGARPAARVRILAARR